MHCLCLLLQMPLEEKYSGVRGQALAPLRHMLLDTPPGPECAPLLKQLERSRRCPHRAKSTSRWYERCCNFDYVWQRRGPLWTPASP